MRIYAECTFLDSRTQARHSTFSLVNQKEDSIHFFYVTLKRWHHILEEKLYLLIITAMYEILTKSDSLI